MSSSYSSICRKPNNHNIRLFRESNNRKFPLEDRMTTTKELVEIVEQLHKENANEEQLRISWFVNLLNKAKWKTDNVTGDYRVFVENIVPSGRVDVALSLRGRVVVCIELKAPRETIENHLKQAESYGSAYYRLDAETSCYYPILTIATNGRKAYLIDCALKDSLAAFNMKEIVLDEKGTKELIGLITTDNVDTSDGSLPWVQTKPKIDYSPFASNKTKDLLKKVTDWKDRLEKYGHESDRAIALSVNCLLLAVARAHEIIPNSTIRRCQDEKNWKELSEHLEHVFGDVFNDINQRETHHFWEIHNEGRFLPVRLDVLPIEYIGLIYQTILQNHDKQNKKNNKENKTKFYTPNAMIDKIINYVKPTINDKILDPTCGSGAFLSAAIYSAVTGHTEISDQKLKAFIENVVGVDKDAFACKIAKVTLLSTFMRLVDKQYRGKGKPLPKPVIYHKNFYWWDAEHKFDIVIGNPPWLCIDNLDDLETKRNLKAKLEREYDVYAKSNDHLCYIVEKAIKCLANDGRFGFVVKLQSIHSSSYDLFRNFLSNKIEKISEYGKQSRFKNYAQTALLMGSPSITERKKVWKIEHVEPQTIVTIKNEYYYFDTKYSATQGAQSSAINVYKAFAIDNPTADCVKEHPIKLSLGVTQKIIQIAYIVGKPPKDFLQWLIKNPEMKHDLEKRKDVQDTGRLPFSWRRDNTQKIIGPILITELNLMPGRDRFPFIIDRKRKYATSTGNICIGSKTGNKKDVLFFAALLISDYFLPLTRHCKVASRREGGVCLTPNEISKIKIPSVTEGDKNKLIKLVTKVPVNKSSLSKINKILAKYFSCDTEPTKESFYFSRMTLQQYASIPGSEEEIRKVS